MNLLLFSFLFNLFSKEQSYLAQQTSQEFKTEVEKKYHYKTSGSVADRDEIKLFDFSFKSPNSYTKEEVRLIIIPLIEEIINRINSNYKLRPYLVQFPYDESGITLSFSFGNDHQYVLFPFVGYVFFCNGKVRYTFVKSQWGIDKDEYEEVESYEDAKRIYTESIREEKTH